VTGAANGKTGWLWLVVTFLVVSVALLVRDEMIYQTLIVPGKGLPFLLWSGSAVPVVIAFVFIGWRVRSFKEVIFHAVTASLADHAWEYISAAIFTGPSYIKTSSADDPAFFWTVGLLESLIFWCMCIGVVHGIRELIKRSENV
jgi:hypothetical protein